MSDFGYAMVMVMFALFVVVGLSTLIFL